MSSVKIFQIGFNKCGTRTLADFFRANGHKSIHWASGRIAKDIARNKKKGGKPLQQWKDAVFFSDMEFITPTEWLEGYKEFRYLDECFPDGFFLLNTRPCEDWLVSRLKHGPYLQLSMAHYGTRDPIEVLQTWKDDWHSHIGAVRSHFADRPGKLLEFDLYKDGPDALIECYGAHLTLDAANWEHSGKTS